MGSFFSYGVEERLGKKNHLLKLKDLIKWEKIRPLLKGIHKNEENSQGGPIAYDAVSMFKALILGQWHNLSDPQLEESLRVRLDFMMFTGFELGEDLPDETTLCRFRNKLIKRGLDRKLFKEINRQLENLGFEIHSAPGALLDATIIESAARPRRTIQITEDREEENGPQTCAYEIEESVDPDARWLKKGKKTYFGYKGFVRTAERTGFIQYLQVEPANISETKNLESMVDGLSRGQALYADKAYPSAKNNEFLKEKGVKNRIMKKAARNRALSFWEKRFNYLVSKKRYLVEQTFGTLKRRFDMGRSRYMTTRKVEGQLWLKATCFNLLKAVRQVNYA